jgi:hypothetical protein
MYDYFHAKLGKCYYENNIKDDMEVTNVVQVSCKVVEPNTLSKLYNNFVLNGHSYHIVASSIYGMELFCMDGVKFSYKHEGEWMDFVFPLNKYGNWMILTRYVKST